MGLQVKSSYRDGWLGKALHWFVLVAIIGTFAIDIYISLPALIIPRGVIIHHSALPVAYSAKDIAVAHRSRGLDTFFLYHSYPIGYHYIIAADGSVFASRPLWLRGSHAKGHNDYIGICLLGDFDSQDGDGKPTDAQLSSLRSLLSTLSQRYKFGPRCILKHSDVADTRCPGNNFPSVF